MARSPYDDELQAQPVDLPLNGGILQNVDKRLLPPGAFLLLENLEHDDEGSLTNREGYGYLPDPGRTVQHVATRGDDLYGLADADADEAPCVVAYHEATAAWARQCDAWRVGYARRAVGRDPRGALFGQRVTVGDNRVVFVWHAPVDGGDDELMFRVEDAGGTFLGQVGVLEKTGATVSNWQDGEFKVCATAGLVVVLSKGTAFPSPPFPDVNMLFLTVFDPVLLDFPIVGSGPFLGYDTGGFDAKSVPVAQGFVVVGHTTKAEALGAKKLKLSTLNVFSGAVVQTATVATVGDEMVAVSLCAGVSTVAVAYRQIVAGLSERVNVAKWGGFLAGGTFSGTPLYDVTVFSGLGLSIGGTQESFGVGIGQDVVTEPDGYIVMTTDDAAVHAKRIDDAGVVAPPELGFPPWRVSSAMLLSEPFALGGRVFALLGALVNAAQGASGLGGTLVASIALVCVHPGIDHNNFAAFGDDTQPDPGARYLAAAAMVESLSGRLVDRLACSPSGSSHGLMVPSYGADGSAYFAPTALFGAPTSNKDFAVGVDEIRFLPERAPAFVEASGSVVSSGGLTAQYDGRTWAECGFIHRPERNASFGVSNVAGTGALATGTYLYAFTYEWVDDAGNMHQSEPGFSSTILAPPGGSSSVVTVPIRAIGLTQKPGVTVAVYRTLANAAGPFYRISPRSLQGTALLVDPNAKSVSFVDDLSDAEMQALGFGFLYTDGGLRGNVLPPPTSHVVEHGGRLFAVSDDDPNEVLYTKELVNGEPAQWARGFSFRVDALEGGATALGSNGERLIVFGKRGAQYVVGDGPDDTGQNGSFSRPRRINTELGCEDPRSVEQTRLGTHFLSPAGLAVVTPGLEVVETDAARDETRGRFCRRAVIDAANGRAYWLVTDASAGDPGDARYVVYDYAHKAWYVWKVGPAGQQRGHCVWKGEHVVCDGRPALRGFGPLPAFDPDGSYPVGKLRTPWLTFGAMGGFQRVREMLISGHLLDGCTLRVKAYVNRDDQAAVQERTINLGSGTQVQGLPVLALPIDVKRQLAAQHMFEISHEAADGTDGTGPRAGVELVKLTFDVGVLRGTSKVAAGNWIKG